MIQKLPGFRDTLRGNRQLPDELKQSCVLLSFTEPVKRSRTGNFIRIHLTEAMKDDGEETFYFAHIYQPHRVGKKPCHRCGLMMAQPAENLQKCRNDKCDMYGIGIVNGPRRGVIRVEIYSDFVTHTEPYTIPRIDPNTREPYEERYEIEYVDRCLLVLDRRYDQRVLDGIYRTAGALCEIEEMPLPK